MDSRQDDLLNADVIVINVGLELFAEALAEQSVAVAQVNWKPPVELEPDLERILDDLL